MFYVLGFVSHLVGDAGVSLMFGLMEIIGVGVRFDVREDSSCLGVGEGMRGMKG